MKKKLVILPIERISREIESRKIIKIFLEKRGYKVKLVNSVFFHAFFPFFKPAFVLENDLTFQSFKLLRNLYLCGFKIITHDEESFGDNPVEFYFAMRFYKNNFDFIEHHFFKGKIDLDYYLNENNFKFQEKVSIANNYRFLKSLLLQNNINDKIINKISNYKIKFNKIVLICSKFSYVNRKDGVFKIDEIVSKRVKKFNLNSDAKLLCEKHLKYSEVLFYNCLDDYQKIIENNQDIMFVIRPHPAENVEIWKNTFSKFHNVDIDNSDTFISWARCVDKVIHNGSTSGLEAFLIGKQVIYYNPLFFDKNLVSSTQKISSLYINSLDKLNESLNTDFLYSNDEYIKRNLELENEINFNNDFSQMLYNKIKQIKYPSLNLTNRINYIFSKLFFYKLSVYVRKKYF